MFVEKIHQCGSVCEVGHILIVGDMGTLDARDLQVIDSE